MCECRRWASRPAHAHRVVLGHSHERPAARTSAGYCSWRAGKGSSLSSRLTYTGRFPFVEIAYRDPASPCNVSLEAFSPFVPQDADASSLPLVFFTFRLRNPGPESVTASVAVSWVNDIAAEPQRGGWPAAGNRNVLMDEGQPAVLMDTRVKELAGSQYLLACLPADGVRTDRRGRLASRAGGTLDGTERGRRDDESLDGWRRFLDQGEAARRSPLRRRAGPLLPSHAGAAVAGRWNRPGEQKESSASRWPGASPITGTATPPRPKPCLAINTPSVSPTERATGRWAFPQARLAPTAKPRVAVSDRPVVPAAALQGDDDRSPVSAAAHLLVARRWDVRVARIDQLHPHPSDRAGHLLGARAVGDVSRIARSIAAGHRGRSTGERRDPFDAGERKHPTPRVPAVQLGRCERLPAGDRVGNPLGRRRAASRRRCIQC